MTTETIVNTRHALRDHLLTEIGKRFDEAAVQIEGGPLDGVEVVSKGRFSELIDELAGEELPAPSEHSAEVTTPATIVVTAACPRCGIEQPILATIVPQLVVDPDGAELKLKAKAKGRTHVCGQLPLPVNGQASGQSDFGLEDIVRPEDAVSDDERGSVVDEPTVEPCPFRGCTRLAEHDGDHEFGE